MTRKPPDNEQVGRISGERPESSRTEQVKRFYEQQVERPADTATRQMPEEQSTRPDHFRQDSLVPQFIKSIAQKIGTGYQTFKLPGTSYVVQDLREEAPQREASAFSRESQFKTQAGQLKDVTPKSYENFLGEKTLLPSDPGTRAQVKLERILSEFEKLLVERFENGKSVAQESADGKAHFKEKAAAEWRQFFANFFSRTQLKQSKLGELESMIYRGNAQLTKGGGLLIGDMVFTSGDVQKFARLRILADLLNQLAGLKPGQELTPEMLKKGLAGEELNYLALAHKHAEEGPKTGRQPSKGLFGPLSTEDHVKEQLGLKRKEQGKKYIGPIKWGDGEASEDEKLAFVPWKYSEREERPAGEKSHTLFFAIIVVALVLSAIIALVLFRK